MNVVRLSYRELDSLEFACSPEALNLLLQLGDMGLLFEGGWVAVLGLRQRGVGGLLERLPRDGLRQLQRALLHRSLAKPLARSLAPSLSLCRSGGLGSQITRGSLASPTSSSKHLRETTLLTTTT